MSLGHITQEGRLLVLARYRSAMIGTTAQANPPVRATADTAYGSEQAPKPTKDGTFVLDPERGPRAV